MKIVVCIKQVPDTSDIRIDPVKNTLIREGVPSIINPADLHAAEEALRLKERFGGTVTAITMGPPQAEEALRELLAMGVDDAVLLTDRALAGADTFATTYALGRAIEKLGAGGSVDLVLLGRQAVDGETGQVGPGLAARLGFPVLSFVVKVERLDPGDRVVEAWRRIDEGLELIRAPLPAAVTIVEGMNKPRRAALDGVLHSMIAPVLRWDAAAIGADLGKVGLRGSPTIVRRSFVSLPKRRGEVFRGRNAIETASWLVDKLLAVGVLGACRSAAVEEAAAEAAVAPVVDPRRAPPDRGVWVEVEQQEGHVAPVSWELLGEGARIAGLLASPLEAVVFGEDVEGLALEAVAFGAEKVYVFDAPILRHYRTAPYARLLVDLARRHRPEVILLPATRNGRDLAGTAATWLETGLTADCTQLDVEPGTGLLLQTRPTFGGNQMATIITPRHRPQMATVRPRVMRMPVRDSRRRGVLQYEEVFVREEEVPTKVLDFKVLETRSRLEDAEIIVTGGRGVGSARNFDLIRDLAAALGGAVGASRRAVEAGFISREHQVGQTGSTVRPTLYLAVGVAGAVQHVVGMQNSGVIAAINRDPEAPIFHMADFGVVGDLFEVVPALIEELQRRGLTRWEVPSIGR